jgi:hypothetical protein
MRPRRLASTTTAELKSSAIPATHTQRTMRFALHPGSWYCCQVTRRSNGARLLRGTLRVLSGWLSQYDARLVSGIGLSWSGIAGYSVTPDGTRAVTR